MSQSRTAAWAVVALLGAGFALCGCEKATEREEVSATGMLAFSLDVRADEELTPGIDPPSFETNSCGKESIQKVNLNRGETRLFSFETYNKCSSGLSQDENAQPGNDQHGVYVFEEDVDPEHRKNARKISTPLGVATVFEQDYFVATNSVDHYEEPVALIALDHPRSTAFPSLVVRSDQGEASLSELISLIKRLKPDTGSPSGRTGP